MSASAPTSPAHPGPAGPETTTPDAAGARPPAPAPEQPQAGTPDADLPGFDVRRIPFSTRGSWVCLSPVVGLHRSEPHVHLVSHRNGMHAVLRLRPVDAAGAEVPTEVVARPDRLAWVRAGGVRGVPPEEPEVLVEVVFEADEVLRVRGHGAARLAVEDAVTELTPFTGTYLFVDPRDGQPVFTSYETGHRYRVTALRGTVQVHGDQALGAARRAVVAGPAGPDADGWEAVVEEFTTTRAPYVPRQEFDAVRAATARRFADYLAAVAPWRTAATPAAALAAYVVWSATVRPAGFLRRESVLMSKHWMDKVWSWDHTFNAMALAPGLPDAALDQFFVVFDQQDPGTGALPDSATHAEVLHNYVKPPMHGWAFGRVRARLGRAATRAELEHAHAVLAAWCGFWWEHRRVPGHVLAHYQHGNDSGWDNATLFDLDRVVEAPDLAAFLALQLRCVGDLAEELGHDDAQRWRDRADEVVAAMLEQLWDGRHFVAVAAAGGRRSGTTSLLNLLPVVAADLLPPDVVRQLAEDLRGHLTAFGPATEHPGSPHYAADGYWRGPVWAPSTVIVEDGLRRGGFTELADLVSERFRALCERSGFAENFDALTGEGLRDRAYTWTASAYLVLAGEWAGRDAAGAAPDRAAAPGHG